MFVIRERIYAHPVLLTIVRLIAILFFTVLCQSNLKVSGLFEGAFGKSTYMLLKVKMRPDYKGLTLRLPD